MALALRARSANVSTGARFYNHVRGFCSNRGNRWRFGGIPFWGTVNSFQRAVEEHEDTLRRIQAVKAEIEHYRQRWGPAVDKSWAVKHIEKLNEQAQKTEDMVRKARFGDVAKNDMSTRIDELSHEKKMQEDSEVDIDPITNRRITKERSWLTDEQSTSTAKNMNDTVPEYDPNIPKSHRHTTTESVVEVEPGHDIEAFVKSELDRQVSESYEKQAQLVENQVEIHVSRLLKEKLLPESLKHLNKVLDSRPIPDVLPAVNAAVSELGQCLREEMSTFVRNGLNDQEARIKRDMDDKLSSLRVLMTTTVDQKISELRARVLHEMQEQDRGARAILSKTSLQQNSQLRSLIREMVGEETSELHTQQMNHMKATVDVVIESLTGDLNNQAHRIAELEVQVKKIREIHSSQDIPIRPADAKAVPSNDFSLGRVNAKSRDGSSHMDQRNFNRYPIGSLTILVPKNQLSTSQDIYRVLQRGRSTHTTAKKIMKIIMAKASSNCDKNGLLLILSHDKVNLSRILAGDEDESNDSGYPPSAQVPDTTVEPHTEAPTSIEGSANDIHPPVNYKVLIYDSDTDRVLVGEYTLDERVIATSLNPTEILQQLSHPSRFYKNIRSLLEQGYDIATASDRIVVFRKASHVRSDPKSEQGSPTTIKKDIIESFDSASPVGPFEVGGRHQQGEAGPWCETRDSKRRTWAKGAMTVVLVIVGAKLTHDALREIYTGESPGRPRHDQRHWEPIWGDQLEQTITRPSHQHNDNSHGRFTRLI